MYPIHNDASYNLSRTSGLSSTVAMPMILLLLLLLLILLMMMMIRMVVRWSIRTHRSIRRRSHVCAVGMMMDARRMVILLLMMITLFLNTGMIILEDGIIIWIAISHHGCGVIIRCQRSSSSSSSSHHLWNLLKSGSTTMSCSSAHRGSQQWTRFLIAPITTTTISTRTGT